MSKSLMAIPKVINVGYNNRSDTYTGKLAFVIYTDEKGKLRKEISWNSWCNDKIPKDEFNNEPTEGFVLNKKVGDYRGSWDGRMAWIRIYDPRGFEFEISVVNLLYILEECTSVKGKGLEGEFVYAWDGADLVLLPVSSQEYVSCREFTDFKSCKVTKKDMVEGHIYTTKEMDNVIYMGRHEWYEHNFNSYYSGNKRGIILKGKKHVFARVITEKENSYGGTLTRNEFYPEAGFTKLAKKVSDKPHPDFADLYDKFKKSINGASGKDVIVENVDSPSLGFTGGGHYPRLHSPDNFVIENGKVYSAKIEVEFLRDYQINRSRSIREGGTKCDLPSEKEVVYRFYKSSEAITFDKSEVTISDKHSHRYYNRSNAKLMSKKDIQSHQFCKVYVVNEEDGKYELNALYC